MIIYRFFEVSELCYRGGGGGRLDTSTLSYKLNFITINSLLMGEKLYARIQNCLIFNLKSAAPPLD